MCGGSDHARDHMAMMIKKLAECLVAAVCSVLAGVSGTGCISFCVVCID